MSRLNPRQMWKVFLEHSFHHLYFHDSILKIMIIIFFYENFPIKHYDSMEEDTNKAVIAEIKNWQTRRPCASRWKGTVIFLTSLIHIGFITTSILPWKGNLISLWQAWQSFEKQTSNEGPMSFWCQQRSQQHTDRHHQS